MDELEIHFKSTNMENPIANEKPRLPNEMWNMYNAAGEGVTLRNQSSSKI